ncbi:MAG: aminodeoxychorismate/anthranilate synthase component II [Deltaproteobacteria bacterium]|nr:aminodeoxychorismate/anthranilate synthase component II [Deltaproteobacteria bacterium]MBW2256372.1 aminodeoxychorismate/anthranilate synthase component II [Deltaproteobacteria bacterium]
MSTARVLLIDNYDSFTFNLVQSLRVLGAEVLVYRNDRIEVEASLALEPTHLMISPGPGRPEDAGVTLRMLEAYMERVPILGVCLGHQALAVVLGGVVDRAPRLMHGKSSLVHHDDKTLYRGLPNPFQGARYHSLAVPEPSLPDDLVVTARTSRDEVMGIRHRTLPVEGVQFHPESVLTPEGDRLLSNFLEQEA